MQATLQCHPASPGDYINTLGVKVQRDGSQLNLRYLLTGQLDEIRWPVSAKPDRRDELWRHTCAELFVMAVGERSYVEFNFSPSGEWAAYEFDDYRQGMRQATCAAPMITVTRQAGELYILVQCNLPEPWSLAPSLNIGLTMVIEDSHGRCSYWALNHPADQPDFHHRDGFVLEL